MNTFFRKTFFAAVIAGLLTGFLPASSNASPKGNHSHLSTSQVDVGNKGMVVSATPYASKIGADVLKKGGNAVDAAAAIQFALNTTEPMMSGIGGGGFMMVYDAKRKKTTIVDSRERAPAGASTDMFLDSNGEPIPFAKRHIQGNAVGVPGTLKGLDAALRRFGTMPMKKLIAPSVKLADHGFTIDSVLAKAIADNKEKLMRSAAGKVFVPNGVPLKEGDKLVQKDLAKTFRMIQKEGPDALYKGKIGTALAKEVQKYGGSLSKKDLRKYDITWDKPIYGDYKGYEIASMPPPSSGGIFLLQMLKLLDSYNLSSYSADSWQKYHLLSEAMHLSYADRAVYAGDPEFVKVPVKGLLDPRYIAERQKLISLNKVNTSPKAGDPWKYQNGKPNYDEAAKADSKAIGQTTHFTVADKWGNIVSYTTTIEQVFGTGIMVPGYGFMLNNELTDFDAVPGGANEVHPNKRPLSSMSPTIVFKNGKPVLSVGSPGGPTIIASVLQTIINKLDYGMELKKAIEEPRIYTSSLSTYSRESGIPEETIGKLNSMGHHFTADPEEIGNVQAIEINGKDGRYKGAADSSRNGAAIGIH
ncbi:gamma-glutamyltransferase [Metabacillus sp. GX 13764]|uniref:gamma-glutamyltransferase n=1 Tax=Metabacillus kandeliae TaxID=2900151 RepID=UPI001E59DE01|nr:gamma-glutamyltransferase [Metabacillus kandeliae]MCD7033843.1 gamma-glutamyltransferase [Metabacillus kandeliae]